MSTVTVCDELLRNYEDYYCESQAEWRRLGACDKAENIVSLCNDVAHDSILEIGAGEGAILERLCELDFGRELHAVEISPSGVEAIKKRCIPRLTECQLFDGYRVPYEDGRFDLAILSHVVEHVEYPRILLREAKRVAKHVFVEVPLEDTIRLSNDFVFDRVGHINFYSVKTIRRLLQTCDLTIVGQRIDNPSKSLYQFKSGRKGLLSYYVKELLLRMTPQLATRIFTYHSALVCH